MGSFGSIFHRAAFPAIIEWIDDAREPFDHMWRDLSTKR